VGHRGKLSLRLGLAGAACVMGCVAVKRARDRELVIEPRADVDRGVRRGAGTELEGCRQPPMLERHGLRAPGDRPASKEAVKLTRTFPVAGPLTCTTSSRPRKVSLTWIVAFGVEEPSLPPESSLPEPPDPPPPELSAGTVRVVCAALAAVALPAALVSHTARLQLPGPGCRTRHGAGLVRLRKSHQTNE